jgi:hypothetical protein
MGVSARRGVRLFALGLAVAGAAACRHRAEPEPLVVPIALDGPRCAEGGPSVEILHAQPYRCGKGDTCTRVDMRIRNPEARALFLLTDGTTSFSGYLEDVSIIFGRESPNTPVWEFAGQNYHQAFRLPPSADVVIRSLEFHSPLDQFVAVFVDGVRLDNGPPLGGTGQEWMLPARGELAMSGLGGAITDFTSKTLVRLQGKKAVRIGIWCVQTAPVPSENAGVARP